MNSNNTSSSSIIRPTRFCVSLDVVLKRLVIHFCIFQMHHFPQQHLQVVALLDYHVGISFILYFYALLWNESSAE